MLCICNVLLNFWLDFLDDKLDDDIACAMKVFDKYGFKNWRGWEEKCKKQNIPNLSEC